MRDFLNRVHLADCRDLLPLLPPGSVDLVVTSPPYAEQRSRFFPSCTERAYPSWTVEWMSALRPSLAKTASVLINIREHVKKGVLSDYVLRTRLALRNEGWFECEELIWHAPDKPPLGSTRRPRRTWERVLWFSPSPKPYIDLYAVNREAKKLSRKNINTGGPNKFGKLIHGWQARERKNDVARFTDVITAHIGTIDKRVLHSAMFPRNIVRPLIQTFSRPGDVVLDPFSGSGTVPLVAQELGRQHIGIDAVPEFVFLSRDRLTAEKKLAEVA